MCRPKSWPCWLIPVDHSPWRSCNWHFGRGGHVFIFPNMYHDVSIQWFPEIGVPPVLIHFDGIFHEINHPAMALTQFQETPYCYQAGIPCRTLLHLWICLMPIHLHSHHWNPRSYGLGMGKALGKLDWRSSWSQFRNEAQMVQLYVARPQVGHELSVQVFKPMFAFPYRFQTIIETTKPGKLFCLVQHFWVLGGTNLLLSGNC